MGGVHADASQYRSSAATVGAGKRPLQIVRIHARNDLPGFDEVALIGQYLGGARGVLGVDVDFVRFQTAIAESNARRQSRGVATTVALLRRPGRTEAQLSAFARDPCQGVSLWRPHRFCSCVLGHSAPTGLAHIRRLLDCAVSLIAAAGGKNSGIGPKEYYGWRRIQTSPALTWERLTAAQAIRCASLFLVRLARVRSEGVVEGLTINILGVIGKVRTHGLRQIAVGWIWHRFVSRKCRKGSNRRRKISLMLVKAPDR
jgi:hypothetical protein